MPKFERSKTVARNTTLNCGGSESTRQDRLVRYMRLSGYSTYTVPERVRLWLIMPPVGGSVGVCVFVDVLSSHGGD